MTLVLLLIHQRGRLVDTACSRPCHASIKSRQTSPTGDERQNKGSQAQPGRQPQRASARRPVGTCSSASDDTDRRIETASLDAAASSAGSVPPRAPLICAKDQRLGGTYERT